MERTLQKYLIEFGGFNKDESDYEDYLLCLHVSKPNQEPLRFNDWRMSKRHCDNVLLEINKIHIDDPNYERLVLEWLYFSSKIS